MTEEYRKKKKEALKHKFELYKDLFVKTSKEEMDELIAKGDIEEIETLICSWGDRASSIKRLFWASANLFLWKQKEYIRSRLPDKYFRRFAAAWSSGWSYRERMKEAPVEDPVFGDVDPHLLPATRSPLTQLDVGASIKCGGLKGWRY